MPSSLWESVEELNSTKQTDILTDLTNLKYRPKRLYREAKEGYNSVLNQRNYDD
jgi:hypothetical protein